MSNSLVTRCPNCGTSFRVSHAQLSVAQGAVRCGACLHIFSAEEFAEQDTPKTENDLANTSNIVNFKSATQTPMSTTAVTESTMTQSSLTQNNLTQKVDEEDFLFQDNPEEDWDDEQPGDNQSFNSETELNQDIFNDQSYLKEVLGQPVEQEDVDESWATEMLAELEQEEAQEQKRQEISQPSYNKLTTDQPTPPQSAPVPPPPQSFEPEPEESHSLLDEMLNSEPHPNQAQPSANADSSDLNFTDEEMLVFEDDTELRGTSPSEQNTATNTSQNFSANEAYSENDGQSEPLDDYRPEISDLDWQDTESSRGFSFLWPGVAVLLITVLCAQYVYFNFDTLARRDKLRPLLTSVCYVFQCEMPVQQDLRQIKSGNLVVRSHPSLEKALIVDVIISNQASFQQPFPKIELAFADLNGTPVASRLFKPDEYLGGELQGAKTMPPKTPIHLSLEVIDPGPKATNYELHFHPG